MVITLGKNQNRKNWRQNFYLPKSRLYIYIYMKQFDCFIINPIADLFTISLFDHFKNISKCFKYANICTQLYTRLSTH